MAEVDLGDAPIFVDVDTDPQFPILYKHLLHEPQDVKNEEEAEIQEISPIEVQTQGRESIPPDVGTPEAGSKVPKPEKPRIKCPECQRYTTETEEMMIRHIRKVHRGENPFQCYMCDYSTYNKSLFEEHVRIHKGIKPFKCSQCPYRSASKKNTKKHELIHRPDNPLKCTDCDFIARHPRGLLCHQKSHTMKGTNCPHCPFKYNTKEELKAHKKNLKRCPNCHYIACSKKLLNLHLVKVHNEVKKPSNITKMFHCALCEWESSSKARILLHLIHHPNQKVDESIVDVSILRKFDIMV